MLSLACLKFLLLWCSGVSGLPASADAAEPFTAAATVVLQHVWEQLVLFNPVELLPVTPCRFPV